VVALWHACYSAIDVCVKRRFHKLSLLIQVDASIDVKPCEVQLMLEPTTTDPDLELEGSHVGRGSHYFDAEVILSYCLFQIETSCH
jgi:hypothetical protein